MNEQKAYHVTICERLPDGTLELRTEQDTDALILACAEDEKNGLSSWNIKSEKNNAEALTEVIIEAFFEELALKLEEIHAIGGQKGMLGALRLWTLLQRAANRCGFSLDVYDDSEESDPEEQDE